MRAGLDHVHLFASDVAATVGFFRTMFGATVVWDEEAAGVRNVRLALGRAFIQLYDQPPKAPRGGAVHHVGIETDDLDGVRWSRTCRRTACASASRYATNRRSAT